MRVIKIMIGQDDGSTAIIAEVAETVDHDGFVVGKASQNVYGELEVEDLEAAVLKELRFLTRE